MLAAADLLLWLLLLLKIVIKDIREDKHKLYPMPMETVTKALRPDAPAEKPRGVAESECVRTDPNHAIKSLHFREEETEAQEEH